VSILATDDKLTDKCKGFTIQQFNCCSRAHEVIQAFCYIRTASNGIRDILTHVVSRLGLRSRGCDTMPQALAASGPQLSCMGQNPCTLSIQCHWATVFSASHNSNERTTPASRILATLTLGPLRWKSSLSRCSTPIKHM
jgi:hypothetical protein